MIDQRYLDRLVARYAASRVMRAGRALLGAMGFSLMLGLLCSPVHAVPEWVLDSQLASPSNMHESMAVDLRSQWQSAVVVQGEQPNDQALPPQDVWAWANNRFSQTAQPQAVTVRRNERYVARLVLASAGAGAGLKLSFAMPRLDAVHVAYRYGDEPWVQAVAGDTVAMLRWPFADRQPTFDLPQRPGKLSLVVQIAHRGVIDAPMVLQNAQAYGQQRMNASLTGGLLVGINLVLLALGGLAALNFRRASFLAISGMTLLMAAVVATNSGIAGVYWFTDSAVFNDQSKFLANTLWCVLFPFITATVLSQRVYAKYWWLAALAWAVVGSVVALWWMQYPLRGTALRMVPVLVLLSTAFSLAILLHARANNHVPVAAMAIGVLLYALSLMAPLLAYLGFLSNDVGALVASLATLCAALLFLHALVYQHRLGHMVMARAATSLGRDMLTGLLNRQGFHNALVESASRMEQESLTAAFFYIRISNVQGLKERYGEEGFEVGMVQMAATLASSIPGADKVGRIAPNAFAFTVMMPRDEKRASHIAQKILGRSMALASHGAPLAQTARIAIAWMPTFGTELAVLERRARRTLRQMENGKRIAWVGGVHAQSDSLYEPSTSTSGSHSGVQSVHSGLDRADTVPSMQATIMRLEKDMLGPDSKVLRLPVKQRDPNLLPSARGV